MGFLADIGFVHNGSSCGVDTPKTSRIGVAAMEDEKDDECADDRYR